MTGKKLASIILGSIGGLFLLTGVVLLFVGRSQSVQIEQAAEESVVSKLSQLNEMSIGSAVMLQGEIAERNELFDQGFVAFVTSRYRGERCETPTPTANNFEGASICESIWEEESRQTPPLWIDLIDGRIQFTNSDYQLQNPSASWQSTGELLADQTIRYEGFKIGDAVFVKSSIRKNEGTTSITADFVFGGDSQTYFDSQRRNNQVLFLLGGIFAAVGIIAMSIVFVLQFVLRSKEQKR